MKKHNIGPDKHLREGQISPNIWGNLPFYVFTYVYECGKINTLFKRKYNVIWRQIS